MKFYFSLFSSLLVAVLTASHSLLPTGQMNPRNASEVATGKVQFQMRCSTCHGDNARGGRGPNLTNSKWKWGGSDSEILRNILNGIPNTQMPAFLMPEDQARAIVAYLRSLQPGQQQEQATGNAKTGEQLFFGPARCARCHMFGGRGGRLGPDLSLIAQEKTVSELRNKIADPDRNIVEGFKPAEVVLRDNKIIRGVAKNEDTFSIALLDVQEKLHLLLKNDVKEVKHLHASLMPPTKLTSSELDDVVAFLFKGDRVAINTTEWKPAPDFDVSFARLSHADEEPQNWLTYWGNLRGTHYSPLDQITPTNVHTLVSPWAFQFGGSVETTPIVVDGLVFVTGPTGSENQAEALDARTGRLIWRYRRPLPKIRDCTVITNRGFAVLGDRLFLGTLDAHLLALDVKTGNVIWDTSVADYRESYSMTLAPLAIDKKIIVGVTSGECAVTGFIDAYDATSGQRLWRFRTVPQKGDPARATWAGESADYGGAPTWMTGTYDVETDTLFWTTGNPGPDYDGSVREGDNLYSCSVLALDPNTGKLRWHFQFSPHDTHDWDSTETPILVDLPVRGQPRKLLIHADRNGFFYLLDRQTGRFLLGKPFAHQTWATGLDQRGRPIPAPGSEVTP